MESELESTYMHTAIFIAHPSPTGFSHQVAATYKAAKESQGHEVTIVDLYSPTFAQDFLKFSLIEELRERSKKQTEIQKVIKLADELVFAFPTWWYDVPAVLKNMIDCHFTAGFAFNYSSRGITGLLNGKKYKVFTTSAAPGFAYKFGMLPHSKSFRRSLKDCGIAEASFTVFGGRRSNGQEQEMEQKWLEQVRASAAA